MKITKNYIGLLSMLISLGMLTARYHARAVKTQAINL